MHYYRVKVLSKSKTKTLKMYDLKATKVLMGSMRKSEKHNKKHNNKTFKNRKKKHSLVIYYNIQCFLLKKFKLN